MKKIRLSVLALIIMMSMVVNCNSSISEDECNSRVDESVKAEVEKAKKDAVEEYKYQLAKEQEEERARQKAIKEDACHEKYITLVEEEDPEPLREYDTHNTVYKTYDPPVTDIDSILKHVKEMLELGSGADSGEEYFLKNIFHPDYYFSYGRGEQPYAEGLFRMVLEDKQKFANDLAAKLKNIPGNVRFVRMARDILRQVAVNLDWNAKVGVPDKFIHVIRHGKDNHNCGEIHASGYVLVKDPRVPSRDLDGRFINKVWNQCIQEIDNLEEWNCPILEFEDPKLQKANLAVKLLWRAGPKFTENSWWILGEVEQQLTKTEAQ